MKKLEIQDLYNRCDPEQLDFKSTSDLKPLEGILGQPRALAAAELGIEMEHDGFNVFALGPPGTGKHSALRQFLKERAAPRPSAPDLCYVNNFEEGHKPRLLQMPPGKGCELRDDMKKLVDEVTSALRAAFESEQYQTRKHVIEQSFNERQQKAFSQLGELAAKQGLALLRTPMGIIFAPIKDDEVLSPEELGKLSDEEKEKLDKSIDRFQSELRRMFRKFPRWQRATQQQVRELNLEVTRLTIGPLIEELLEKYQGLDDVVSYLLAAQQHIQENAISFVAREDDQVKQALQNLAAGQALERPFLRQYRVNLLVDHSASKGAPVVYEDNPTYQNLVGRVEHIPHLGAVITDFSLIKPGALHRANGGYLLLDAQKLLMQPYAYEGLKRVLQSKEVKVESLGQALSLVSTYSLEPEPLPLSMKIVLIGAPMLYYLLSWYDEDFNELFKVAADFSERMDRTPDSQMQYARLIAKLVEQDGLKACDRAAVARVIEHGSRMLEDTEKLPLYVARVLDLLREADYWASKNDRGMIAEADVQQAIDARIFRSDRVRQLLQEEILRRNILVDSDGAVVGQVNGLSVLQLGDFAFGRPSRITARVRLGKGEVIDIEREVELSGPFHSKGVLVLSGYLGAHYVPDLPLSLSASLVFEQSYSEIDGDSASSAELYALLSAISEVPLKQSLAVTGSVNQRGEVQAIGGVNEKVEGFFDLCRARGLKGDQGVLIPASNVKHLMLRSDVREAVEAGQFHLYSVQTVDEGIEVLTGMKAGERDGSGQFPEGTLNALVEDRLIQLSEVHREFASPSAGPDKQSAIEGSEEP